MRAILLVLIFAVPALAQKAKKPVNLEAKVPPAVRAVIERVGEPRYIEVADPIDLAHAEIKRDGRQFKYAVPVRNDPTNELRAFHQKESEVNRANRAKGVKEPEWIPVGIQGAAIWVKYDYPAGDILAKKEGRPLHDYDKIFLIDRMGRLFCETDSEHFRKVQQRK